MRKKSQLLCLLFLLLFSNQNFRLCCAEEGIVAKVEHLLLAPKLSNIGVQNIFYYGDQPSSSEQEGSVASQVKYAQRVILGYEGENGGGAQLRWFTFDQDLDYSGSVNQGTIVSLFGGLNLDVDAIDAELTQRGNFGIWNWTGTAGARYARLSLREKSINFEDLMDTIWFGPTGVKFEGAGPTLSASGERNFGDSGASFFARGRTSMLFGDSDLFSAFRSGGIYTNANESVIVWELQLGTNIERNFEKFDLLTGVFWEAQKWDSDSDLLGDIGFHGFGITTGIRY